MFFGRLFSNGKSNIYKLVRECLINSRASLLKKKTLFGRISL